MANNISDHFVDTYDYRYFLQDAIHKDPQDRKSHLIRDVDNLARIENVSDRNEFSRTYSSLTTTFWWIQ